MKIISILFLIILLTNISSNLLKENEDNFNIPNDYISDPSFISMANIIPNNPSKIIYASPSGSNKDCSEMSPCSLKTAISNLQKGYTLYLKGGIYDVNKGITIEANGDSSNYIYISSSPNEKAIITSSISTSFGLLEITGSYIIIENITFKDVTAKNVQGIVFYNGGQNHIIIRNNIFDSLKTTNIGGNYGANGILLMGESSIGIKQVIIYGNIFTNNVLGYSEALSIAGNCEEIYVLYNKVQNNTNIGIDFYGNAGYCEDEYLDQPRKCVAMYNNIDKSISPYADCAGLYVDGGRDILLKQNTITNSQYGIEIGSEEKNDDYPVKNIIVEDNIIDSNTEVGIRIGGFEEEETGVVRDCIFINNTISNSDYAIIVSKTDNITFEYNQIYEADSYFFDIEFSSDYAKNIVIENNIFSGNGKFIMFGSSKKLTLDQFIANYPSNKKL